ncbi:AAA family ATPase [Conexibacter stalactiti]|uniref:AAA family ATPase n=1 Tax=Conexibacter stalactiti TaxID=1940611 RepID=A0ABU4HMI1_9ACTN|nr:AAA family ATPase [Conexibacter stalactiti]MDW5593765.1 AAA family ATPase [Conexibacter stalactiti]MEC5034407.1 AAA family ATPase [Conexibacter stalactiti]
MQVHDAVARGPAELPLVGRDRELSAFARMVGEARDATSRAVLLRGEAGIGKSSLLTHAVAALAADGWLAVDVRADELDRLVPYSGLRHAVASCVGRLDAGAAALAVELVAALDVASEEPPASLHAAAARFFSALAAERPVVLAFDDLALADDDTVVLVASLLRQRERHALVLAGNLRSPDAATPAAVDRLLERLHRDGLVAELALGPLSDEAVEQLVTPLLAGAARGDRLVAAVQRHSDGNPFFALQAVLNLTEGGAPGPDAALDQAEFSENRLRWFLRRVLRVGPDAHALGRAVALLRVVGPGRVGLAAELAELSPAQADAAFDSLVGLGILRLGDDGGYRVCHDLVREALYQEIGAATRWRWHRLAADRLAELPSSPALDLEVADHVRHVAEPGDERAIEMLTRAAERAGATAPQSSIAWFRAALAIAPPADPRHALLLSRLSRALLLANRPQEAIEAGRQALQDLPDGARRARLATQVVDALILIAEMEAAAALVDAELARGTTSPRFLAKAAHVHMGVGRAEEALERARLVETQLPQLPADERIVALSHLMRMRFIQRRVDELLQLCDLMEEAAQDAPPSLQLAAHSAIAYAKAGTGETRLASAAIGRTQQVLAAVGWTLYKNDLAIAQVQNATQLGDWSSALSLVAATSEELEAAGSLMYLGVLRAAEIEILANRGEWAAARRASEQPLSGNPHCDALQVWACAGFDLLSNDLDAARTRLKRQLERPTLPRWVRALLLSRLAEVEVEAGRPALAAELTAGLVAVERSTLDHQTYVAARLAHGRATGDVEALTDALAVADEHALTLQRGQVRLALGALDVDPERNLTEAARIFQSLEAAPWRRRANAELRRRGLPVPRQRARSSRLLTETEEQVARLVHQRCTNREIAATVFLSVKTVEAYLSRIYAKTGCANRVDLARAIDAGLLDRAEAAAVTDESDLVEPVS